MQPRFAPAGATAALICGSPSTPSHSEAHHRYRAYATKTENQKSKKRRETESNDTETHQRAGETSTKCSDRIAEGGTRRRAGARSTTKLAAGARLGLMRCTARRRGTAQHGTKAWRREKGEGEVSARKSDGKAVNSTSHLPVEAATEIEAKHLVLDHAEQHKQCEDEAPNGTAIRKVVHSARRTAASTTRNLERLVHLARRAFAIGHRRTSHE